MNISENNTRPTEPLVNDQATLMADILPAVQAMAGINQALEDTYIPDRFERQGTLVPVEEDEQALSGKAITRRGFLTLGLKGAAAALAAPVLASSLVDTLFPTSRAEAAGLAELRTFGERPPGAIQVPGTNFYYVARESSQPITTNIQNQLTRDYNLGRGIDPNRSTGILNGSLYVPAVDNTGNSAFVEASMYERAAFTPTQGPDGKYNAQRQRISSILFEGKIQITPDQTIPVPENVRAIINNLPITGEGSELTPKVGQVADILTTDKSKARDAGWSFADQKLTAEGVLSTFNLAGVPIKLSLGEQNSVTGHRVPDIITTGLNAIYKDKVLENVGLPLSPPMWVDSKILGAMTPVLIMVFERGTVTFNPNNDTANQVQIALGGNIVWDAFTKAKAPDVQPTPVATETPKPVETGVKTLEVEYDGGRVTFRSENGAARIVDKHLNENPDGVKELLNGFYREYGYTGKKMNISIIWLPDRSLDDLSGYNNGGDIYTDGANTSSGIGFNWASVDMRNKKKSNGEDIPDEYEIYCSVIGPQSNIDLLAQSQGSSDGDSIDYGVGAALMMRLGHISRLVDFGARLKNNPSLKPLIGNVDGQIDATKIPMSLRQHQ